MTNEKTHRQREHDAAVLRSGAGTHGGRSKTRTSRARRRSERQYLRKNGDE